MYALMKKSSNADCNRVILSGGSSIMESCLQST